MELEADVDDDVLTAVQALPSLANLTDRELAAEQENALRRHQHARRWHPAGFASRSTAGAAPALALAVVQVDAFLHNVGMNATVRDLQLKAQRAAHRLLPRWTVDWAFNSEKPSTDGAGRQEASPRKERSWWGSFTLQWMRVARRWGMWLRRMEELNFELYSAAWETVLLIVIVVLSRLVLMRRFRR
jgi:hypothetical protein